MGFGSGFSSRVSGEGDAPGPNLAEVNSDWRSNRPARAAPPPERPSPPARRPSVPPSDVPAHPAHVEQTWAIGSKFRPSAPVEAPPERKSMFGGKRADPALGSGVAPEEESDWRAAPRRTVSHTGSTRGSPTTSTPPTPQLGGRRKLELLPRGTSSPAAESPLSSPKSAGTTATKASPFGAAKPVDASVREKEVEERLEQDRLARATKEKERETSWTTSAFTRSPPAFKSESAISPTTLSSKLSPTSTSTALPSSSAKFASSAGTVRPKISFAAAAAATKAAGEAAAAAAASVPAIDAASTPSAAESGSKSVLTSTNGSVEDKSSTDKVSLETVDEMDKLSEQVGQVVV